MSKPEKPEGCSIMSLLHKAQHEMMSASSSLAMEPEEMNHEEDRVFLCDTDKNAHHSVEHIRAASHFVGEALRYLEKVRFNLINSRVFMKYEDEEDI